MTFGELKIGDRFYFDDSFQKEYKKVAKFWCSRAFPDRVSSLRDRIPASTAVYRSENNTTAGSDS